MPRITRLSSRNPRLARARRIGSVSGRAISKLDPYAVRRRSTEIAGLERGFNVGEVDYDVFKSRIEKQQAATLGGSFERSRLEETGQRVQLAEFGRGEEVLRQEYQVDPTKYNEYASILSQHQTAFGEDSPFYLQYGSKISTLERDEQDRMDTDVANQYLTGSFSFTSEIDLEDTSIGLNLATGSQLEGFDAYQGYIAAQRAKYEPGTAEYVKYDSLLRQNFYAKEFSDILAIIGTEEEGQAEERIKELITNYQPGTPQYDSLVEQLKVIGQNKLDNAYNLFVTNTVDPSIAKAQSKVDLDITNLVYSMSKGLTVEIDGKIYNFAEGTPQQQQDLFNTIYGSLVDKKNQLADPKNIPQKPVMAFDPETLSYTFEIPDYKEPAYSSRISYQPVTTDIEGLPESNVVRPKEPAEKNIPAEQQSIGFFGQFTGRGPDFKTPADDMFVKISTYGYEGPRDMDKERAAGDVFRNIFGKNPESAEDWNKVAAIAYSGIEPNERWVT